VPPETPIKPHVFTRLQLRFIEEYPNDCKKGAAARRAGASPKNAHKQGCEWYANPHIRAAIDERMALLTMSADEAAKQNSDIAATRLNDYLQVVVRTRTPMIPQPLAEAIAEIQVEIDFEHEYSLRSIELLQLTGDELQAYKAQRNAAVNKLRLQQLRWQLELENYPGATREIPGEPEAYEDIVVNMPALAKAEGKGRIKKLSFNENGPVIEMYDAQKALDNVFKLNGRYIQKLDLTTDGESLNAPDAARAALLSKLAEGRK
jgi:phage terminase small subunit